MRQLDIARSHGLYNVITGLWPLAHMRSFELVFGPKSDTWLVRTVAGLLIANGLAQLRTVDSSDSLAQARRIGIGTAATLAFIDAFYGFSGRISKMYLLDAAAEVTWILLWQASRGRDAPGS
ncbi:hypothetical protein [Arthrobacter sp. NPDC093139]|uniref:hypothetical protein n=1 Tax=Arthrobacter sp. NPDC093139 TaxID=3363945 RepID=UPI0038218070